MTIPPPGKENSSANRFDALRLAFASFVVIYHIIALAALDIGGSESAASHFADLGVKGFFVISGALVFGSFQRSESSTIYFSKRIRRLFPAYVVIVALPTLIAILFALAQGVFTKEITSIATYFGANIVFLNFLHPELPGFFDSNRFTAVNGALWTIKIEVMFYAVVPIIGAIIARLKRKPALFFLLLLYVAGEAWRLVFESLATSGGDPLLLQVSRQLPGQMAYFSSGIALWLFRNELRQHVYRAGVVGVVFLALSAVPYLDGFRPAGIAAMIAFAAWAPGAKMTVTRWGDLSYGIYITHFPIIQTLVALGIFEFSPILGVALVILLVVASALAMWRWIERPWLRKDSHYRRRAANP